MSSPVLVQFPHPGAEHVVKGTSGEMPWNTGPSHKRKFLSSAGSAVDESGAAYSGELEFWGEWEAESRFRRLPSRPTKAHPRWVHRPFWRPPATGAFRQNTDPYVFGRSFRYSNCKQLVKGRPSGLQRLQRGSVLLFGSSLGPDFVVDTVFVVARARPWSPSESEHVDDATLRVVTCDSVGTNPQYDREYTLYEGASPAEPVHGAFSFVPCQAAGGEGGFARPAIRLAGLVNPASLQAPRRRELSVDALVEAWQSVRDQVLEQDLLLGVSFATPACETEG